LDIESAVSLATGIIGTAIAIYQTAVLKERKKRDAQLQYLLAGIGNSALTKSQTWINQISLLPKPENESELAIFRVHARAKDDLSEIHNLATALEGVIDAEGSAITSMLKKIAEQGELNNRIQEIGLRNPSKAKN
jgi:hypothetical protein